MNFPFATDCSVLIPSQKIHLEGILHIPENAYGLVLFVHGSGSSRFSTRNKRVATTLNEAGIATLLFDLFTPEEEIVDDQTRELRFNIEFLASRLIDATNWCLEQLITYHLNVGYFGASTGGGAALVAAGKKTETVKAVVSRGGRPDLADESSLSRVIAPTLLIVGGNDGAVIEMNKNAMSKMQCIKKLEIVPGATHLFEEPGTLDQVSDLAKQWFSHYLQEK